MIWRIIPSLVLLPIGGQNRVESRGDGRYFGYGLNGGGAGSGYGTRLGDGARSTEYGNASTCCMGDGYFWNQVPALLEVEG